MCIHFYNFILLLPFCLPYLLHSMLPQGKAYPLSTKGQCLMSWLQHYIFINIDQIRVILPLTEK